LLAFNLNARARRHHPWPATDSRARPTGPARQQHRRDEPTTSHTLDVYDLAAVSATGETVPLSKYRGGVTLFVNVASF